MFSVIKIPIALYYKTGAFFMLNYIWGGLIGISIVVSIFTGKVAETSTAAIDSAKESVEIVLSMVGIMCFWMGLMEIANRSGLMDKFAEILSPVINFLFKDVKSEKAKKAISMNMAANIFGIGNAATPFGLLAMEEMARENKQKGIASNSMCMLVVVNTASIQLIPTTLLALRGTFGSANPFEIMPAVWITSVCSVVLGVVSAKVMEKRRGV